MNTLTAATILTIAQVATPADHQADVFDAAHLAPRDTAFYLHLTDARAVVEEFSDRPLAAWALKLAHRGQIQEAWHRLARATGLDDRALLDHCLGREMTLLTRPGSTGTSWVVLTDIGPDRATDLLKRLRPRVAGTAGSMTIYENPVQRLRLARRAGTLLVGPSEHPDLFAEVVQRLDDDDMASLADEVPLHEARRLGAGTLGLFVRHDDPLGGCSAIVARLGGARIDLRLSSAFENPPFTRPRTNTAWDASPLRAFEDTSLVAFGEPTDIGPGRIEQAVAGVVGHELVDARLRRHLTGRQFFAVGEQEMRLANEPIDLLAPTFAVCIEARDTRAARVELDRAMDRFLVHLSRFSQHLFSIDPAEMHASTPRRVELDGVVNTLFDGAPLLGEVSLTWTVEKGRHGTFCIIASHPQQLGEAARALHREPDERTRSRMRGRFESVGTLNGVRLGRLLTSWSDQAGLLAEPGKEQELREGLALLADLTAGIDRCRWKLARPADGKVDFDLEIRLAPPASARSGE